LNFIEIKFKTDFYREELILRERYLRMPLGLNLSESDLNNEDIQLHFGVLHNDELIACIVMKPINQALIKLRQMVVKEEFRSIGVGSMLLDNTIKEIVKRSFELIQLNARLTAIKFYEKNGFIQQGSTFIEVGIPHVLMIKTLNN
jgi:predicted GNAT family N-acyltransferase